MKDRVLKSLLLNFFVQNGWYPQLEVDVKAEENATANLKFITDIDVLAMFPSNNGTLIPIIGDCKTLKGQSPVNRVLWMRGLMDFWGSDRGYIILQKQIESDHKQMSDKLGITLLSDVDFVPYSKAFLQNSPNSLAAMALMENWEIYFEESKKYPNLLPIFRYLKYEFWNEKSSAKSIRSLLFIVKKLRGEFNPNNRYHVAVTCDLISIFSISINNLVMQLFKKYPISESKINFESDLKLLIWGGYDNYKFLNDIRAKVIGRDDSELELPEWNKFVQMIRNFLDSPMATINTPMMLKEVAFELLDNGRIYNYLSNMNPYEVKCAVLTVQYFIKATKLPDEFSEILVSVLMKL